MGRLILLGMEEVIGGGELQALIHRASITDLSSSPLSSSAERTFPFEAISGLMQSLEQTYGVQGGRGIALRTGRSCFKYGLREYGEALGVTDNAFRMLPLSSKIRGGAKVFAELFNQHTDQRVQVEESETHLLWHVEHCPLCWGRQAGEPVCYLTIGLLQESLYWLSGGKIFQVEETACCACGDARCTFAVTKTPLA